MVKAQHALGLDQAQQPRRRRPGGRCSPSFHRRLRRRNLPPRSALIGDCSHTAHASMRPTAVEMALRSLSASPATLSRRPFSNRSSLISGLRKTTVVETDRHPLDAPATDKAQHIRNSGSSFMRSASPVRADNAFDLPILDAVQNQRTAMAILQRADLVRRQPGARQ